MENHVSNFTKNGQCSQCGMCCSNLLPLTDKEIETIQKYIKHHGIRQQKHFLPLAGPGVDLSCPFLDSGKRTEKCLIYEVRPLICSAFLCSEPNGAVKYRKFYTEQRKVVDLRKEFFPEEEHQPQVKRKMF